jgi:hypothetical protein
VLSDQQEPQEVKDRLVLKERQEQQVQQERLDLQVILEAQAQREQQGQLDLKELLAQLDQLVVPEPPDLQAHRE